MIYPSRLRPDPDLSVVPLLPTLRYEFTQAGKFQQRQGSMNAGLLAYALEAMCAHENLASREKCLPLRNAIVSEAILDVDGAAWWRWEKSPSRQDYLYPIDWDDQLKAMDAILAYNMRFPSDSVEISFPTRSALNDKIVGCIYHSDTIGEDFCLRTNHTAALYMFDQSDGKKNGNKEDIFVTAVVLRSAFSHGLMEESLGSHAIELFERLVFAANHGLSSQLPFHTLSRCYFSWAHFLYLIREIAILLNIGVDFKGLIEKYSRYLAVRTPTIYEIANDAHDAYYRKKIGVQVESNCTFLQDGATIIYRHRRLAHYYGSLHWDSVLGKDMGVEKCRRAYFP